VNVVLSCNTSSESSCPVNNDQIFNDLVQLQKFYSSVISFIVLVTGLSTMRMNYRRMFNADTRTLYYCRNSMSHETEDRDWFRSLAVP
jgi:hypothetical protein